MLGRVDTLVSSRTVAPRFRLQRARVIQTYQAKTPRDSQDSEVAAILVTSVTIFFPGDFCCRFSRTGKRREGGLRYVRRATGFYETVYCECLDCTTRPKRQVDPAEKAECRETKFCGSFHDRHHDVDFETSFRIRIFASCVDLALNQIFIQGRRNVQRNGKSYLRRKSDFFSTRLHT